MDQKLNYAVGSVKSYCAGINNNDLELISNSMHFPHYRIQIDGSVLIWNTEQEYLSSFRERTTESEWAYSKVDAIVGEVISEQKCHITARFSRYKKNDVLIAEVAALYVVIFKEGRWGMNA